MLTGEQIELRKRGLGGSEIGIVVGESERMTARELFHIKRGELEPDDAENLAAWLGHEIEPVLTRWYEEQTGRKCRRVNQTQVHPDLPWLFAHPDRMVVGRERGCEIKMRQHLDGWGYPGTDEVPADVLLQCQTYMEVCDRELWDVVALFRGIDARIYTIPRDQALIDTCIDIGAEFVERIASGEPPDADFEHRTIESLVKRLHPQTNGAQIDFPPSAEHWHAVLEDAKERERLYADIRSKAKAHLLALMGDAAVAFLPDGGMYNRKIVRRTDGVTYPTLTYKRPPKV